MCSDLFSYQYTTLWQIHHDYLHGTNIVLDNEIILEVH